MDSLKSKQRPETSHLDCLGRKRYPERVLHVVLFQPEIPHNTGSIGRMCVVAQVRLHLIHPLGFIIDDKHLKRAGMDYWPRVDVREHADWQAFLDSEDGPSRLWLVDTKASDLHWDCAYRDGDGFIFGRESSGVPEWLFAASELEGRVRIPQLDAESRSLNLATCVGITTYEAMRQLGLSSTEMGGRPAES